ncbi:MAG: hypothetical protein HOV79_03820 [Hamadaea sp.]|nr:hypothetical protein [Hamadaea sp.]
MHNARRTIAASLASLTLAALVLTPPGPAAAESGAPAAPAPAPVSTVTTTDDGGTRVSGVIPAEYLDEVKSLADAQRRHDEVKNAPQLADPQQEALRMAYAAGQKSYRAAADLEQPAVQGFSALAGTPPSTPDPAFVQECRDRNGWVKNRYEWCKYAFAYEIRFDSSGVRSAFMFMNIELIGYGRDDGVREVAMHGRPTSVLFGGSYNALTPFTLDIDCAGGDPGCSDSDSQTAPLGVWFSRSLTGEWFTWTVRSDENASPEPFIRLLYHRFDISARFPSGDTDTTQNFGIRCDSAPYFNNKPKACIFTDVLPHLQYSIKDENGNYTNQREVAEHIREAQDNPNATYPPELHDKEIPGKYTGDQHEGYLNRIPGKDSTYPPPDDYFANERVQRSICATLTPDPAIVDPQCDEYPFKSTLQGLASPVWDYSVKYVTGSQNASAGAILGNYYTGDRILYFDDDRFYVEIRDQGGAPSPGPTLRTLPSVEGFEGEALQLWASSTVAGQVRWTYEAVDSVDPGTSCSFSDSSSFTPTITCNDDGLFKATITLDTGAGTLHGETYVEVKNRAPEIRITEPTPWQLFRVGAPIIFNAPFTDAGNDTHRCEYYLDNGTGWGQPFEPRAYHNCGQVIGYDHAGMYTVTVHVADDDGGTDSAEVMIIVYDPREGSATISGSTATPPGALVSVPNATGSTNIVYNGQYPLGGETPYDPEPNGQVLSWVSGTTFRLERLTMEWLVITVDGKVAARGTGTVAGQPGYTWVLYGWDSCDGSNSPGCASIPSDRIRLVVFESATGRVVYDHSPGSGQYDVDRISPTAMTSGAVRVRRFPD